jgi:DNA-binding transcriptional MocR family regulator
VKGIQRRAVRVPRDTYDALRAVAFATGEDVAALVHQALQDFLATEGHRRAVAGFATRAGRRHRAALERLDDP